MLVGIAAAFFGAAAAAREPGAAEPAEGVRRHPHAPRGSVRWKKEDPESRLATPGHKPGNDLLSRDLSSYYHWLLGA